MLIGPLFTPKNDGIWRSNFDKKGMHYNVYSCRDSDGMRALREMFPDATADELNFVLFSTSGIHGTYNTIEEAERSLNGEVDEDGNRHIPDVTFVIIHPRTVTIRCGNAIVEKSADIEFLRSLRASSWAVAGKIGQCESR